MIAAMKNIGKRLLSPAQYLAHSIERFAGSGTLGGETPPFNQAKAVQNYQSWAYIASNIVARECAQHPLRLYVKDDGRKRLYATEPVAKATKRYHAGKGADKPSAGVMHKAAQFGDDYVEVTEPHPAITTLCDPNPFTTGFDMAVLRWVYLQLTGNAYLHPVCHIQTGVPDTVWVMPSQWTEVAPDDDTFIAGYVYGTDSSNKVFFERDEVVHFKLPNPGDLYYGRSVLESIWSVWALHGHKRTMDLAHFENRARPDWIASIGGGNAESIKRFEEAIAGKHRGPRNAGRMTTIGTNDFNLHQMNFPPEVISDPDRVLDEIAGGFGVPRARITGNQSISGGGSEQADLTFVRGTVAPMLRSDEETLNNQWLPLFGLDTDDAFLAYDNPVPTDKEFDRETRNQQLANGRITINEANQLDGLEPVEGGDVPRFNGVPLDQVGQMPPAPAFTFNAPQSQPAEPASNTFVIQPRSGETPATPAKSTRKPPAPAAGEDTLLGKFMDGFMVKVDAEQDAREGEPGAPGARLEREVARVLSDAGEALEGQLAAGADINWDAYGEQITGDIFDATLEPITEAFEAGGVDGVNQVGADADVFSVTNPRVAEAIESFNLRLAGGVSEATVSAVQSTLAQGADAGESIAQLTQRVQDTGMFDRQRAETIARTESARGYVQGKETGWEESGVVERKQWLLAPNACPYCVEAAKIFNKAGGQKLGETPFKSGDTITPAGQSPMKLNEFGVNGPPLHPNDRCDIIAVVE